jgi:hypothetical protein
LDKKIKLVKINLCYKNLDFFWKQSTLKKGIQVGYDGALAAIQDYLHASETPARLRPVRLAG